MTVDEYKEEITRIDAVYVKSKNNLYVKYAASNEIYKKGDIIKDHRCTILINRITAYKDFGLPEPAYSGKELKKDLTPKKNGDRQSIYGNDRVELVKSAE